MTGLTVLIRTLVATGCAAILSWGLQDASAWALSAPRVSAGDVRLSQAEGTLNIEIRSRQAILEWTSFDVGPGETINFIMPDAAASVLNRAGAKGAHIQGAVNANGAVLLTSLGGVSIEPGATLTAAQWTVSWHSISNAAYLSRRWTLTHPLDGGGGDSVTNRGVVQTFGGGSITLVGDAVDNAGFLFAPGGRVQTLVGKTIYGLSDGADATELPAIAIEPHPQEGGEDSETLRVRNSGVMSAAEVAMNVMIRAETDASPDQRGPMLVEAPFEGDHISVERRHADTLTLPLIETPDVAP